MSDDYDDDDDDYDDDDDDEKRAAVAAALEELFRQYAPSGDFHTNQVLKWRNTALYYARNGATAAAFFFARGTGVPNDVLDALKALLGE